MAELSDSVLLATAAIPSGKVSTYGDLAKLVGCGPRLVARILSSSGGSVCWWRVVRSDGTIAAPFLAEAAELLAGEGVPVHDGRVEMARFRAEL